MMQSVVARGTFPIFFLLMKLSSNVFLAIIYGFLQSFHWNEWKQNSVVARGFDYPSFFPAEVQFLSEKAHLKAHEKVFEIHNIDNRNIRACLCPRL